jgi:hypothetical protein
MRGFQIDEVEKEILTFAIGSISKDRLYFSRQSTAMVSANGMRW